uniref:Vitamin K-dependent gamma-carboxylase isoform X1 n=1 Tax=Diabrotica virgifera virgifera TaxID=50390 RepID=A0A6P7G1S4_DIAVI
MQVTLSTANYSLSLKLKFKQCWTRIKHLQYKDIVIYMYQPADPSSLGIIRFLFGLLMLIDLSEERGGSIIDLRWGHPNDCHFPLFPILKNPGYQCISLLYLLMWLGAAGIMLGYKFQISTILFGVPYWYLFLLDKSLWNNHSYLFGLISILLMGSSANQYFSLDGYLDKSLKNRDVPYWNYFILKYQFFLLYFLAGLKKMNMEWLDGYAMANLGEHWIFTPFSLVLYPEQIAYFIVHWFGFLLDLTIGFWMLIDVTRPVAFLFCASFHLMNSRLFSIGMFPYVCLATMPLFCEETWPKKIMSLFTNKNLDSLTSNNCVYQLKGKKDPPEYNTRITWQHKLVVGLVLSHCSLQLFLPYSHFITKGYNNWTNGLYGYSWDMMVHSWDTVIIIKVVDNENQREHFVDPQALTDGTRWGTHADMCVQYAQCLKRNIIPNIDSLNTNYKPKESLSSNISVYIDVWCSLNKRFTQRMYNPNYDLLKANWSPFQPVEWLLPLLTEYNNFREQMDKISEEVYSWSPTSDVMFVADFPGFTLENFIKDDVENATLTVLEGTIVYEIESTDTLQSEGITLHKDQSTPVEIDAFHKIHTISNTPSRLMYTFSKKDNNISETEAFAPFPLIENMSEIIQSALIMWTHIKNSVLNIFFGTPYTLRSRI